MHGLRRCHGLHKRSAVRQSTPVVDIMDRTDLRGRRHAASQNGNLIAAYPCLSFRGLGLAVALTTAAMLPGSARGDDRSSTRGYSCRGRGIKVRDERVGSARNIQRRRRRPTTKSASWYRVGVLVVVLLAAWRSSGNIDPNGGDVLDRSAQGDSLVPRDPLSKGASEGKENNGGRQRGMGDTTPCVSYQVCNGEHRISGCDFWGVA